MALQLAFSECIFVGRLISSVCKGSTRSLPPHYMMSFSFGVNYSLRGDTQSICVDNLDYLLQTNSEPKFKLGDEYIVGVNRLDGSRPHISFLMLKSDANASLLDQIRLVPIGWKEDGGKFISPFPSPVQKMDWFSESQYAKLVKCSNTGRPGLMCPIGVQLEVDQVIEPGADEKMAPFGDGKFIITVSNTLDQYISIPALLNENGNISWEDSLVLIDADSNDVWTFPGSGRKRDLLSTSLAPGQKVKTMVNVLTVEGSDEWKAGGTRVYLLFCLGNVCKQNFFYYYTNAHEQLHAETIGKHAFSNV